MRSGNFGKEQGSLCLCESRWYADYRCIDKRYFFEFNFGYNGSDNFAKGKRFGFFPSYALGYIISNEDFFDLLLDTVIAEEQANMAYEFTFLFLAVCAFIYVVLIKKQKLVVWDEKPKMAAALCETVGQYFYVFAIGANPIIAAPVISSYCLLSVVWSRIFLKEKLTAKHYALIAMAGVGMAILGFFDA